MGLYATTTSISVLMPNFLVGNTTTSDAYGAAIWSKAAERGEAEVIASVVARYDPSTWTSGSIPPLVVKLSEDLACLYAMRSAMTQDSQIKNPNLADWESAYDTLTLIQQGIKKLNYTNGSLVPTRSSSRFLSSTQGYSPTFNLDDERAWGLDTVREDDISSGRE